MRPIGGAPATDACCATAITGAPPASAAASRTVNLERFRIMRILGELDQIGAPGPFKPTGTLDCPRNRPPHFWLSTLGDRDAHTGSRIPRVAPCRRRGAVDQHDDAR